MTKFCYCDYMLSRFKEGGDKKIEIKSVFGGKLESMNYKG